jgi:Major capsid protein N-terminus/Large eukaryotic DNA virus major capsid protein
MAGGVLQLVRSDTSGGAGAQMEYLIGNPEVSFFKTVFRRHTNFSMEPVHQLFTTKPVLDVNTRGIFTCRINRVADLIKDVFFRFKLPAIYSSDQHRFRWIENLSKYALYKYTVTLDTQTIDQRYGEWMDIWSELSISQDKKNIYDKMSGNTDELYDPTKRTKKIIIRNNKLIYSYYPEGTVANGPSIPEATYYVPLDFWFSRHPGLALPLVALQYQNLDIIIEMRSLYELCQVYDAVAETYVSIPTYNGRTYTTPISFGQFLYPTDNQPVGTPLDTSVDLDAYLDCQFIYLDTEERTQLAKENNDYLVERVFRTELNGLATQGTIELKLQNPVKELIWLTRRSDTVAANDWSNFTNRIPSDTTYPIMKSARLLWNGMERIEEKERKYFNLVQPYLHHTRGPREGIYVYSFALKPEDPQPTGAFNASSINRIQLYVSNESFEPGADTYDYEYVVYSVYNNIFRTMSGMGSMVFAY